MSTAVRDMIYEEREKKNVTDCTSEFALSLNFMGTVRPQGKARQYNKPEIICTFYVMFNFTQNLFGLARNSTATHIDRYIWSQYTNASANVVAEVSCSRSENDSCTALLVG